MDPAAVILRGCARDIDAFRSHMGASEANGAAYTALVVQAPTFTRDATIRLIFPSPKKKSDKADAAAGISTETFAHDFQQYLASSIATEYIESVHSHTDIFVNLNLRRETVYKLVFKAVLDAGDSYGTVVRPPSSNDTGDIAVIVSPIPESSNCSLTQWRSVLATRLLVRTVRASGFTVIEEPGSVVNALPIAADYIRVLGPYATDVDSGSSVSIDIRRFASDNSASFAPDAATRLPIVCVARESDSLRKILKLNKVVTALPSDDGEQRRRCVAVVSPATQSSHELSLLLAALAIPKMHDERQVPSVDTHSQVAQGFPVHALALVSVSAAHVTTPAGVVTASSARSALGARSLEHILSRNTEWDAVDARWTAECVAEAQLAFALLGRATNRDVSVRLPQSASVQHGERERDRDGRGESGVSASARDAPDTRPPGVTAASDAGVPVGEFDGDFVMYNCARLMTLIDRHNALVCGGRISAASTVEETRDYARLNDEEWALLIGHVVRLPGVVAEAARSVFADESRGTSGSSGSGGGSGPALPPNATSFAAHRVPEFLSRFCRDFSAYYNRVRLLPPGDSGDAPPSARVHFIRALRGVVRSALLLMDLTPIHAL